jgi:hypothetical protein
MVPRTLLTGAVGLLTAAACLATPHTAFLDFDHDHDLWTINPLSPEWRDTVTIILQVGDDPLGPGDCVFFMQQVCVCEYDDGHGFPEVFCGVQTPMPDDGWCNETLFDYCEFDQGVGLGCEPPQMLFNVASGAVFEPGERYRVCQLEAEVAWHPCQYYLGAHYDIAGTDYGTTNYVWLNVDPASVDEESDAPEPPTVGSTWGRVKSLFR